MTDSPRLIGLTGTNGAGKGAAADFFVRNGYAYFSLSDLIREELAGCGLAETRDNMIRVGNRLRESFGADVLARRILERVEGDSVIDSIRNPREIEFLRTRENFTLLAIDAPVKIRHERVMSRGRDESSVTLEEFIAKEAEEMSSQEKGQQLHECMKLADATIQNSGTLYDLYEKLEAFL